MPTAPVPSSLAVPLAEEATPFTALPQTPPPSLLPGALSPFVDTAQEAGTETSSSSSLSSTATTIAFLDDSARQTSPMLMGEEDLQLARSLFITVDSPFSPSTSEAGTSPAASSIGTPTADESEEEEEAEGTIEMGEGEEDEEGTDDEEELQQEAGAKATQMPPRGMTGAGDLVGAVSMPSSLLYLNPTITHQEEEAKEEENEEDELRVPAKEEEHHEEAGETAAVSASNKDEEEAKEAEEEEGEMEVEGEERRRTSCTHLPRRSSSRSRRRLAVVDPTADSATSICSRRKGTSSNLTSNAAGFRGSQHLQDLEGGPDMRARGREGWQ